MGRSITKGKSRGKSIMEQLMGPSMEQNDRIVYLSGVIDEQVITQVSSQLFMLAGQDPSRAIQLVISTYGGYIDEMFSLYDTIQLLPCPVHTIGLGKIMSAGVLLLACGAKGERQIGPNARVMIHSIRGGVEGNIFEIINSTDEMKRHQHLLVDLLVKHTTMSKEQVDKFMKAGYDCYVTAQEAINLGIVDRITPTKK